jgi:hypothetical protein
VDSVGSRQGPMAGSCDYGNEPLGSGTMEFISSIHMWTLNF